MSIINCQVIVYRAWWLLTAEGETQKPRVDFINERDIFIVFALDIRHFTHKESQIIQVVSQFGSILIVFL